MGPLDKTVLVVEDNDLNMKLFHDLLEMGGYNVLQAKDGMEGWRMAREQRPDLILMDIQLPSVDGLEVTKWLKDDENLKLMPQDAYLPLPGHRALYGFPLGHERFGKTLDGLKEVEKRNRLHDIAVATTFADLLFIALHRKSGDCNHRDRLQVFVVL